MRVFITGGRGFIGSNLIEYLLDKNIQVGYCDNLFSSSQVLTRKNAIQECGDISEITPSILSKYDSLVHLAAVKKHNALNYEDEKLLFDTNMFNTAKLFRIAAESNIKNIIFSSSLYANGNMKSLMVKEADPVMPLTLYGQSKLFGEFALSEIANLHKINAVALRLYFIYGPKQYSGKGYPSIFLKSFQRMKSGSPPLILNDGLQRLDYMYVTDLCNLIFATLLNPLPGFNIFNASSGNSYSIKSVVELICAEWNKRFATNFSPSYASVDFTAGTFRSGDNSNARSAWGWFPEVPIEAGISRMLDWYLTSENFPPNFNRHD